MNKIVLLLFIGLVLIQHVIAREIASHKLVKRQFYGTQNAKNMQNNQFSAPSPNMAGGFFSGGGGIGGFGGSGAGGFGGMGMG